MKNIKFIYMYLMLIAVSAFWGCESIEDTYKNYAGNGKIRYVGQCTNLEVETGWKRFVFKWDNSTDPMITNIKIAWTNGTKSDSVLLPSTATSYQTKAVFENNSYTFKIYAVDDAGNTSIPMVYYGRPYTYDHELVNGFTTLIKKHFFVGTKLIMILDGFNPNISSAKITYYQAGVAKEVDLTKTVFDGKYLILDNVDKTHPVTVSRVASIEGCLDEVTFKTYDLKPDVVAMNRDFMLLLKERYNLNEIEDDFIKNTTELDLNYSLTSLEDILYFPNLKKITIGGGRYVDDEYLSQIESDLLSTLVDTEISVFALQQIHKILGVTVDIYNNHYNVLAQLDFASDKGNPVLPTLDYLNTTDWTVTWEPSKKGFKSNPERILDNDPETFWQPNQEYEKIRTHELVIDMKGAKVMKGVRITQTSADWVAPKFAPMSIHIQTSNDGTNWEEAFYHTGSNLGNCMAESTVLYFPKPITAKFVKAMITDIPHPWEITTSLGDFMIF